MDLKIPAASSHKNVSSILQQLESDGIIGISVDCVIFGFDDNELKVLLIKSDLEGFEDKWSHSLATWSIIIRERLDSSCLSYPA